MTSEKQFRVGVSRGSENSAAAVIPGLLEGIADFKAAGWERLILGGTENSLFFRPTEQSEQAP